MPKLTIDGMEVEVEPGLTVLQACEQAGIEIPRFCYHERLSIAGSCRMCLVEMERAPKPVASCAMPVGEGMVIHTDTDKVRRMRQSVMEFLLINHPLDCPICDQGGECDLQDQAMAFGCDRGRYSEVKRAVAEKDFGPLIKTEMTRCIQCTRCVRFMDEIAGVSELGATARGEHMEIGTYVSMPLGSELSGNLVDICPVGALTSRPFAYRARSWELKGCETIDVMDAVGSNIRVDSRGNEVMRIVPRLNEDVNEEWISDKSRFACDGLKSRRLDQPYVRRDGRLQPASWAEAFAAIAERVAGAKPDRIAALAGDQADSESMFLLKELMGALGATSMDCRQDGAALDPASRASYLFNTTIAGIEEADACLLIGTNPRWEAPIINARLRKRYLKGGFKVASVGPAVDLTYPCQILGDDPKILKTISSGRHDFAKVLKAAENPMLILGQGALIRPDGATILGLAHKIAEGRGMIRGGKDGWIGFNVLHTAAARVGGLDLGFVPGKKGRDTRAIVEGAAKGEVEVLYLLEADEIDTASCKGAFVIYQGHHGDVSAAHADVVLPGAAYTEKNATYVNTEGRAQQTRLAVHAPGQAREDWKIIRVLSDVLGRKLPYDSLEQVRAALAETGPSFAKLDEVATAAWDSFGKAGTLDAAPLVSPMNDFYKTDPISRASATMARCSEVFVGPQRRKTGTDG
jgi:NADH-quinone oxidoreductase subunit G